MANTTITNVYAMIHDQKVMASYDAETDLWTVEGIAPAESSWSQPGHVYQITLHAEDLAGNVVELTSADPTYGDQLAIRVLETTPPVITITEPTEGSVSSSKTLYVSLAAEDAGGSGINTSTLEIEFDGRPRVPYQTPSWRPDDGDGMVSSRFMLDGYAIPDGVHTLSVKISDNDGNVSEPHKITFTVAATGPELTVNSPFDNIFTNAATIEVRGVAKAKTEYSSLTEVTINKEPVYFDPVTGEFSKEVSLVEGANLISVVATVASGASTRVIRNVTYDRYAPVISDVTTEAITVNASGAVKITFKVVDTVDGVNPTSISAPVVRVVKRS